MKHAIAFLSALMLAALGANAAQPPLLHVGVASIDVTPDYPVRLHGYGNRRTNAEGVAQKLFAKALVFGTDRQGPAVLITVDNLGVPGWFTDELAARLKKRARIAREKLAISASHTHSAPMLTGVAPNIFSSDIIPEQQATIDRYTRELMDKMEALVMSALSNRAPARVSWAEGRATFAKNRRVIRGGRAVFGENDTAPVDHSLPALFIHSPDGKLRSVLVNYACHCTTLGGEWNQIHGDWSGCAQEAMERDHPGVVALVSVGCGADANPSPRGRLEHAKSYGDEIAAEVRRLLAQPARPMARLPEARLKRFDLDFDPLPTRAQWEERARRGGIVGYHAQKNLDRLDRGEKLPTKLPYSVQSWVFGDELAMIFLPGEVVVDYQLRLKRELDGDRLWINAYANDSPCYIPSRRILSEGGYEAEDSLWYYDRPARLSPANEDRIIEAVRDVVPRRFHRDTNRADAPRPLSPQQALNSMRVAPEFAVELVAAEPLVIDPVAIDWGADGKLWVAEMHDYPTGLDGQWKPGGCVKILEDRDGDGRYERASLFLDKLPFPTGVFAWRHGVLICAAPDILYAEDTNGDGRADVVRKVFTGFVTDNYQARVNSLSLGLDGWVYGANGLLGGKIRFVESAFPGATSLTSGTAGSWNSPLQGTLDIRRRDFRMHPDTGALQPASGLTQQGRVRDDFGNWFGCDNSHLLWHYPLADEFVRRNPHVPSPNAAVHVPQGRDWNRLFPVSRTLERFNDANHVNRVTSACGVEIYRDVLLGPAFYGNAFTCEPVHNLVQRQVLTPDGVTFRSTRATNELTREFLASTDNWFRPAQARTGPDGALWVVDMYRFVIEHPRWIPSNRLAQLDVRAGDDRGRIYRVRPKNAPLRPNQPVARMSARELVAALDSPNGTRRDIVHRELLNRGDTNASAFLQELARTSSNAAVRVQSLAILQTWNVLSPELLERTFAAEIDVAAKAALLRIGGPLPPAAIKQAAQHPDARVRFQAVLNGGANTTMPDRLLAEAATNAWMRAALLGSVNGPVPRQLLPKAVELGERLGNPALADGLFATVRATEPVEQALESVLPKSASEATAWRLRNTRAVLDTWRQQVNAGWPDAPAQLTAKAQALKKLTQEMAELSAAIFGNERAPEPVRIEALKLLAVTMSEGSHREVFNGTLRDAQSRSHAIAALLAGESPEAPALLFAHWTVFSPQQRERVLNGLAARLPWQPFLLGAIESGVVSPTEVSLSLRHQLLAANDASLRSRAGKLWPNRVSNRAAVVAEVRREMKSPGVVARGAEVFQNHCAACHAFAGIGTSIGPDLTPWRGKSTDDFLLAILDPNAAVEPRYITYSVQTKSGGAFQGVIRSETATSVALAAPGISETLLRHEIARMEALPASLMPEGFELGITPAEMSDLIAFLQKPAPRSFGQATAEEIRTARDEFRRLPSRTPANVTFTSAQLEYPSWLGALPLAHCRQSDGNSRVTWQATPVRTANGNWAFSLAAAMGYRSQPAGTFTLRIDGQAMLTFDVALEDAAWTSPDQTVQVLYEVKEANAEDSNGLLTIEVTSTRVRAGQPVTFEVIGSASRSQRWFGIYRTDSFSPHASGKK